MTPKPNGEQVPELHVSKDRLKSTVRALTGLEPPRNYANLSSLNRAADYIKDSFIRLGFEVQEQAFEVYGNVYRNIIAAAGPPEAPRLIVGAHYDVCGELPGADDNASGIAGLLEIATLLKTLGPNLKHRIDLVAYCLEEPPFFATENMGSFVHAKSLHDQGIPVIGMISLEMIGFFSDEPGSQHYPFSVMKLVYPSIGNYIAVVGNVRSSRWVDHVAKHMKVFSVPVETLKAPSIVVGVDFSDHRNFWEFGYPGVMITDTAFYRNPNYHDYGDIIDTLDFESMQEVVKGVYWAVASSI